MIDFINANQVRELINNAEQDYLFGVDFELENGFFIPNPKENKEVLWRIKKHGNLVATTQINERKEFKKSPISYEQYNKLFAIAKNRLDNKEIDLLNLTVRTPIETQYTLQEVAQYSNTPYLIMIPDTLVCFSPETFIKISNGVISTNPMKGTIDATIPNAMEKLMNNPKEQSEHETMVRLGIEDLGTVSTNVTVKRFRYTDILNTSTGQIIQTSSEIEGNLAPEFREKLGNAIFELLPAGSIAGAPKERSLEVIRESEPNKRGFYCGIFGYYEHSTKTLETAVMIRFIEQDKENKKYFRSGGGVTRDSISELEYQEVNQKIYLPFQ